MAKKAGAISAFFLCYKYRNLYLLNEEWERQHQPIRWTYQEKMP